MKLVKKTIDSRIITFAELDYGDPFQLPGNNPKSIGIKIPSSYEDEEESDDFEMMIREHELLLGSGVEDVTDEGIRQGVYVELAGGNIFYIDEACSVVPVDGEFVY